MIGNVAAAVFCDQLAIGIDDYEFWNSLYVVFILKRCFMVIVELKRQPWHVHLFHIVVHGFAVMVGADKNNLERFAVMGHFIVEIHQLRCKGLAGRTSVC